ncbi:hypothetical protein [Pseudoalteromonas xiamenensis]|uniref:Uncharacterized protein n=1 Tax=Pseudoalteromonas xiamenensis TaxID=882626 RepID=A0A975DJP4_9GAMM|nr:hypothetical protein [Pseudoalteromonas xiamenensis]QTH72977.1 hypothetical protein J5O05_17615 [Pseudoalteromonas xiamenensis]
MNTNGLTENQKLTITLYLAHPVQAYIISLAVLGLVDGIAFRLTSEICAAASLIIFALVGMPSILDAAFDPKVGLRQFVQCCIKNSYRTLFRLLR